ncbi:hypothetical protein [Rubrivivax sp. A210]|uniref:hypothetical protein n=1 Tax=Rubrivivax sp. A210 TaxID=2772301 RepID=UPI00191A588F|nr:hypothetical protein [Rubrivivax sp. A210]
MNTMHTARTNLIWACALTKLHAEWALKQFTYRMKVACCDLGILWCNVKIFWYQ